MSRSSGVGVDDEPTAGVDLPLQLRRAPARVPGEDPHRFEVGAGVVRVATEVDGADAAEQWLPGVAVAGIDAAPTRASPITASCCCTGPPTKATAGAAAYGAQSSSTSSTRVVGGLVEHESERAFVGVLDHEHDRPEEVGIVRASGSRPAACAARWKPPAQAPRSGTHAEALARVVERVVLVLEQPHRAHDVGAGRGSRAGTPRPSGHRAVVGERVGTGDLDLLARHVVDAPVLEHPERDREQHQSRARPSSTTAMNANTSSSPFGRGLVAGEHVHPVVSRARARRCRTARRGTGTRGCRRSRPPPCPSCPPGSSRSELHLSAITLSATIAGVRELRADELLPSPAHRLLDRLLLVPAVPLEVEVHPREVTLGEPAGVAQQRSATPPSPSAYSSIGSADALLQRVLHELEHHHEVHRVQTFLLGAVATASSSATGTSARSMSVQRRGDAVEHRRPGARRNRPPARNAAFTIPAPRGGVGLGREQRAAARLPSLRSRRRAPAAPATTRRP